MWCRNALNILIVWLVWWIVNITDLKSDPQENTESNSSLMELANWKKIVLKKKLMGNWQYEG